MTHATEHTTTERPRALDRIPDDAVVHLDVREDLRQGREPFAAIMAARDDVPAGGALTVRAIFEPAPLYRVMARHGFDHWTEELAEDDWRVWFFPASDESAATSPAPGQGAPTDDTATSDVPEGETVVLDVRGLEPPEPMVRTLEALEDLPDGATLVQLNVREPRFLFPRLEERGFTWEVRVQDEDLVRVFIRRAHPQRILDVRVIPPREKHPAIFQTFDALEPGEAFVLVNDHDPKPLRYQFQHERTDLFEWTYLEEGPAVWRVRIARREEA